MFNSYTPYYMAGQPQRVQPIQPMPQQYEQFNQPQQMQQPNMVQPMFRQTSLQGKTVDAVDVVKAMDIPLDR